MDFTGTFLIDSKDLSTIQDAKQQITLARAVNIELLAAAVV
jgi:hypothetical protein